MKKWASNAVQQSIIRVLKTIRGYWYLDEIYRQDIGIWMKSYWYLDEVK